jgi:hypothetical protein
MFVVGLVTSEKAGGHGPKTLPNQTEGATGSSHLGTGAVRNSKFQFMPNRHSAHQARGQMSSIWRWQASPFPVRTVQKITIHPRTIEEVGGAKRGFTNS